MSNNIYDILKKMQSLETPKANLTEGKKAKPDFLDMDKDGDTKEPMKKAAKAKSKGAVAEAVAQVERQLNEKYQGFKKMQESEANEDMLSPGQKKIARMSPPPDKIDANDLKALRAGKDKMDEGMVDDAADRAIANVNARTSREVNDEFRRSNLNPSMKSPNTDKFKTDIEQSRARGDKFYDTPEKFHQGPFSGQTPANILSKDAEERDIEGQNKYRDRTSPGIINKAKDFIGYDKPDSAYGPKDTKVKEGSPKKKTQSPDEQHKVVAGVRDAMRKGYDNVQKGRDERAAARFVAKLKYGIDDSEKTNEGFPTVADAKKRMDDRDGKTAHGKKTITKTGTRHERDYDAVDRGADVDMTPKGRGRPKKDRFA